jgi:hypothetical protein
MAAPLKFGFLSELVSIHFPEKNPQPPGAPYDLTLSVVCVGSTLVSEAFVAVLSGLSTPHVIKHLVSTFTGTFSFSFPVQHGVTGSPVVSFWVFNGVGGGSGFTVGNASGHLLQFTVIAKPHGKPPVRHPPYVPINNVVFPWWGGSGFFFEPWVVVPVDVSLDFVGGLAGWGTPGQAGSNSGPS